MTLNRRDLASLPVPETKQIWRDLHVRNVTRIGGKQQTRNIRIEIVLRGVTEGAEWFCGLEFDYANPESLYCRPLGWADDSRRRGNPIPDPARGVRAAYLPPMSGMA